MEGSSPQNCADYALDEKSPIRDLDGSDACDLMLFGTIRFCLGKDFEEVYSGDLG